MIIFLNCHAMVFAVGPVCSFASIADVSICLTTQSAFSFRGDGRRYCDVSFNEEFNTIIPQDARIVMVTQSCEVSFTGAENPHTSTYPRMPQTPRHDFTEETLQVEEERALRIGQDCLGVFHEVSFAKAAFAQDLQETNKTNKLHMHGMRLE